MEQNTNSAAYLKLQPNRSNGIGKIVQEHIRYWRQFDEQETAKKKAQKAREAEFARKINKDAFEMYDGLSPEENQGFLNAQIISAFESKKEELLDLSKRALQGDNNAMLKYLDYKKKFQSLANVNKVYGEKALELEKMKSDGNFNPYIDEPTERFKNSLSKGLYKLNPNDLSIEAYNPNSKETITIKASELLNNEYLASTYHSQPKFDEYGPEIASSLLDNIDGNKQITPQTEIRGISAVKSIFNSDPLEATSWYALYLKDNKINPQTAKPYAQLSDAEKTKIAKDYYNKNVSGLIQQTIKDTTLEDRTKKQSLRNAELLEEKRQLEIDKLENPKENPKKFKIQAITDDESRLAKSKGKESNNLIRFEGFKPFEVLESLKEGDETREKPIIKSLKLDENDNVYYLTIDGVKDRRPFIIDQIVSQLKFKDKNELVEEMKANRDLKLKSKKENKFDPTNF